MFDFDLCLVGDIKVAASGVFLSGSGLALLIHSRSSVTRYDIEIAAGGLVFSTLLRGGNKVTFLRDVEVATG